jgi:hypothetical protein
MGHCAGVWHYYAAEANVDNFATRIVGLVDKGHQRLWRNPFLRADVRIVKEPIA